ncbi:MULTISPECIES: CopD family protein [Brachymonas]|uniref:CopD family protein n=1 Tax=Brachymonas TaxID=28219 RepID=UPI002E7749B1|nr:CopD family protein [Brachymonas sp. J145]MEE1652604.1 CopD family protein [Brachymonas sp. J145]
MYGWALLLHVLGATVWTGGHLILACTVLPRVLREQDVDGLLKFESAYERIGMPALLVQVITGFWMAMQLQPDYGQWLAFGDPVTRLIGIKLFLLLLTVLLALDARFRVIPRLHQPGKLTDMAWHIVPVTLIGIVFVATGVSLRTGWLA